MTSSQKKLAAHNARNLIGADDTAAKKAAREGEETGASMNSIDGAAGGVDSKHGSPQQAPVQPRAPPCRMLRFADVIARTGLSRTTIWRRVRNGNFPAPIKLGENSIGWPDRLIDEWLESRPQVHYAPDPNPDTAVA